MSEEALKPGLTILKTRKRSKSESSLEKEFNVRKVGKKTPDFRDDTAFQSQVSMDDSSPFYSLKFSQQSDTNKSNKPVIQQRIPTVVGDEVGETSKDDLFPPITTRQLGVVAVLAFSSFFSTIMISSMAPFFPQAAKSKGLSLSEVALIFGIFELFVFLFTPLCQRLLDITGSKNLFVTALMIEGMATILLGYANELPSGVAFLCASFFCRILQAVGDAAFFSASVSVIANEFPERIGSMVALLEVFIGLGVTLGPPISGGLYEVDGYQLPFFVNGISLLVSAFAALLFLSWTPDVGSPKVGRVREILQIPSVLLMSIAVVLGVACINFLDPTLQPHLSSFELSPFTVGIIFLAVSGVYTAAAPIFRIVTEKIWLNWEVMLFGVFAVAIAMLTLGPSPFLQLEKSILSVCLSGVLLGVGVSAIYVPAFENVLQILREHNYPESVGTYSLVSSLFQMSFAFGGFLGPTFGGLLSAQIGFPWASTAIAALNVLVFFLLCLSFSNQWIGKRRRKKEDNDLMEIMNESALISQFHRLGKPSSSIFSEDGSVLEGIK